ncbi:hypothetical protein CKO27_03755 [Thiocystis violacea]|nr:hypothetical protein [Thiocystis violacea]
MFARSPSIRSIAVKLLFSAMLFAPPLATVEAQETAAQEMARAIARMMEAMGFTGAGGFGSAVPPLAPGAGHPMGMTGWPSALGQIPGAASMMPYPGGSQAGSMANMMQQAMPGGASSWGGAGLEGLWEDNQGGLLIVQGGLYRIYSSCKGYIEGDIHVGTNRLDMTNRSGDFTQTFEFALDQGRLALRDQSGQVYLYRRLILDRPADR